MHATVVPFRLHLSSGKVLLVLGVLVSIAGVARHHLIGVQKAALNVNVAISKLSTGQPRDFRRLVADYTDTARPVEEIDAEMAKFPPDLQERWGKIKALRAEVDKNFPRTGGQRLNVRSYKVWRALHPPLTILLFAVLAFHVWDVLGGTTKFFHDEKDQFVEASSCAGCHSRTYQEWAASAMTHAQTSTITVAQLPVTLAQNRELVDAAARDNGGLVPANNNNPDHEVQQGDLSTPPAKVCTTCHAQVGARFAPNADALLPFDAQDSAGVKAKGVAVSGGGAAVQADGVGCTTCHGTAKAPVEMQAATGILNDEKASGGGFGAVFAPLFEDPNPLPQRIHDIGNGDGNFWNDPIQSSQLCGACHNVKVDLQGDGLAVDPDADPADPNAPNTTFDGDDSKGTPITDLDTAQNHDANNDLTLDENKTDPAHDVVLQTTYDEWQDYVAFFDAPDGFKDRYSPDKLGDQFGNPNDSPLGCSDCHMPLPSKNDPTAGVVDHAPGVLSIPQRDYHEHTFVGVDYDLDPKKYDLPGLPDNAIDKVLADREALIRSAVTMKVAPNGDLFAPAQAGLAVQKDDNGDEQPGRLVTFTVQVRNNLLAHTFPTGFAFARQFWLQVSAKTKDGTPICLSAPYVAGDGSLPVATPCRVRRSRSRCHHDATGRDHEGGWRPGGGRCADRSAHLRCQRRGHRARSRRRHDEGQPGGADRSDDRHHVAEPRRAAGAHVRQRQLRSVVDELPEDPHRRRPAANRHEDRGHLPELRPEPRADPRTRRHRSGGDRSPARSPCSRPGGPQLPRIAGHGPVRLHVLRTRQSRHHQPGRHRGRRRRWSSATCRRTSSPISRRRSRTSWPRDSTCPKRPASSTTVTTRTGSRICSTTWRSPRSARRRRTNGDETLGCDKGPQNVVGGSILDCVDRDQPVHTVKGTGFGKDGGNALPPGHPAVVQSAGLAADSGVLTLWSAVLLTLVAPFAWWRLRRRRRRTV